MSLTTDPSHPGLKRGADETPVNQQKVYLVLSPEELRKGFVKPFRKAYKHQTCGGETHMGYELSATYARDPWFYGGTYCCTCRMHRPLNEFTWLPDGESMSPSDWSAEEHERIAALKEKQKAGEP